MDAESTICLSDMVPALRWSRPQQVAEILADPRLPGGWWASVALKRALDATGVDWLCERLARLAVSRWDHLTLTDLLPALQVHPVDPALPGWPEPVQAAVKGAGGWFRLRRLTPHDLQSASAAPEAVLATLFREIFTHPLIHPGPQSAAQAPGQPAAQVTLQPQAQQPNAQQPNGQPQVAAQAGPLVPGPRAPQTPVLPAPVPQVPVQQAPAQQAPAQQALAPQAPAQQPPVQQPHIQQSPVPQAPGVQAPGVPPVQAPAGQTPMQAPPAQGQPQAQAAPADETPSLLAPPPPLPPALASEHPMVGVVDGLFRSWDPLARAVAAQRLFAAEPVGLRTLAHELNVDRETLSHAQRAAEERVLHWLRSPDSTALTGHLFGLTEWLGAAATQEQLIAADPSHPIEVPVLGTPLWRVLVTLMPDRRLQDGWLVVGDLAGLRDKSRQILAGSPPDADVVQVLGQLGIRAHSARAWLDSIPPTSDPRSFAPLPPMENSQPLPRRTPGANGHQLQRGGVPIPSQANNGPDAATALAALNALTGQAPRPHLVPGPRATPGPASDPRRWQRIDVTSGHLRGEPVAVPEVYATQLGMRPGTLLSVTGPGDNAVVLIWRDRQPMFDSLQPVLMRLNARPGDAVYVTVDGYRLDAQLTS
ncbi:hypothetical protein [Planotetraspora kaengkrachanensis]|uniref:Uncharacterized protein n=1 Tax=Planotetraspora kaengkrachanensis TaxID=575193 RepID=A0A8J3PV01_9ACTN|nr:hypothetical protein [Planotetraspora kaengkrachanensis]GIG81559.1 hypothetical protein Pka01_46860 [Planotetraspora kaengkrachanensis]